MALFHRKRPTRPQPVAFGQARRKPPKKNHSTLYFLLLTALVILGVMAYNYRADIKMHIMHYKPQPVKTVTIANTNLNLQEINTPELTSYDVDKILSFHYRDEVFYLALRSQDGESTHIDAFDVKNGSLFAHRSFGEDGVFTIHEKMILSVNVGSKGEVYYVRNGIHTLKDGNDIISLKGSTTATRVALLPGDQQAYLYGNDNFTLADIHDGSFDNNHPAFLHNRAKPFAGGLTLVRIAPDGTVFGGGRIKTNDFNIVASFSPQGKQLQTYGSYIQTDKDSIYNLVDLAVLDHYVVVIDGFTLKIWNRDGHYLGAFNSSKLLDNNLNCAKLTAMDSKTLGILAYVRNPQTKLIDIKPFTLQFPN